VATVKALACALPAHREQPLSRSSTADLTRLITAHPDAPPMSRSTVWHLLATAARKPWQHQTWLFPRDPDFAAKAGRVLDLYQGAWDGQPVSPEDCVVSADEKTSIQARVRCHATTPSGPYQPTRVEHGYTRGGALAYLAAWDVRRGRIAGRCDTTTGIAPFGLPVDQVMQQEPYASAPRVFWIADTGSSHRGAAACRRLQAQDPTRILAHLPIHASWLNQIGRFFSIVQRKVLTPNDFPDLAAVEQRLLAFETLYNDTAVPFHWRCTRADLERRRAHPPDPLPAAAPSPETALAAAA